MVKGNNKGFTLIELAIVLVIIGLIIGSVLKGKDLINSSKQKKFYTSFLKNWELATISYYDRTGFLLGDGVNHGGPNATSNGLFDNINTAAEFANVETALRSVGLEVPSTNTSNSYQYTFSGAYSGSRTVSVNLYYLNNQGRAANRLYLPNVPTDLAIAIDKFVDGQVDAQQGNVLQYPDVAITNWPDASTTPVVNLTVLVDLP